MELCEQFIRTGAVLGLLVLFLPQNPERTVGLIVVGIKSSASFPAVTLVVLCRRRMAGLPRVPAEPGLDRRICSIAVPIGLTALLGNLMGSANAVLIPSGWWPPGCDVSEAMSAFGVLSG